MRWKPSTMLAAIAVAAPLSAQEPTGPLDVFYIGHSLVSDIPDMVRGLDRASGSAAVGMAFREQFIPGAPLRWQWEEQQRTTTFEPVYQGAFHQHLPRGGYEVLVATDSVPRGGPGSVAESQDYLNRFARFAWEANPATRVYYYETWHCIDTGTPAGCAYDTSSPTRTLGWRDRLVADRPMWESLVDHVNRENPGRPRVHLVPAGTALVRLVAAIEAGELPGFATARDLFDDEIHLNPYGKYFVGCVHYATLLGRSPEGLTADVLDRWGRRYWDTPNWQGKQWPPPADEAVKRMQVIAWEVVSKDPAAGVYSVGEPAVGLVIE